MKKHGSQSSANPMEAPRSKEFEPWRDASVNFNFGRIGPFFRRNRFAVLATSLGVAALLFGASLFLFKKYTAAAVVLADPRAAIESLVQATRTDSFLGAMVDDLELTKDADFAGKGDTEKLRLSAIEKLASGLTIRRRGATYAIDIAATTTDPDASARIANAAARKILGEQTSLRSGTSARTAGEIEGRLAELRRRIQRAEEAAAELKTRLKVTAAGEGAALLEQRVEEFDAQLVSANAHTAETRARYEQLRKAGATAGESLPPSAQSSVFIALRADYARLSRQSADQATVLGPRHPEVASLNAQIADIRRQIRSEISRMLSTARADFLEAGRREAESARQLEAARTENGELGPQLVKLSELEREAKADHDVYEELSSRQRELTRAKDLEPSDIRIVSFAAPPSKPSPPRMILAACSAALGLLAGLGFAIQREWRRGSLRTTSKALRPGGAEIHGFLPMLPIFPDNGAPSLVVPDLTPWLTEFCADVAPAGMGEEGVVIFVSSTHRGEGRSTVAINLAASFSRGDDRVLLIEADRAAHLRKPPFGLLDVLETGEGLEGALVDQAADGYTLLPYGGRTLAREVSIGALMSGMTLRATLKLARNWFDVIVIDGPPALEAPHARFLSTQADRTILLVDWDKTSADDANAALDRLDPGAVILYNKTDAARLRLYDDEQKTRYGDELAEAA